MAQTPKDEHDNQQNQPQEPWNTKFDDDLDDDGNYSRVKKTPAQSRQFSSNVVNYRWFNCNSIGTHHLASVDKRMQNSADTQESSSVAVSSSAKAKRSSSAKAASEAKASSKAASKSSSAKKASVAKASSNRRQRFVN